MVVSHATVKTHVNRVLVKLGLRDRAALGSAAPAHHDAKIHSVAKVRTTLTIDEEVLRWVKIRAARTGRGDSAVIEQAIRRDLGLELLDRLWERNDDPEDEATALAVEAQHRTRPRR